MRILHLAKYYWPRSGGMERVVQGLAEGAANLGHQVEVVAVETLGRAGGASRQRSSVTRAFSLAALGHQEIAPGYIATEMVRAVPKEILDTKIIPQIPAGRLGTAEEIARCVTFLAADEAGFITGSCLDANGGQYMA